MSASQYKLHNLILIVDYNKYISLGPINEIMKLDPLHSKLESFGWSVVEVNGHHMDDIVSSLESLPLSSEKPTAIISNTIKGKGVSFMENVPMWHFRGPNQKEIELARKELHEAL